jgi:uncharacterized protein YecE (DUF72 family)
MSKYQESFDMVELRSDTLGASRPSTVRAWRRAVNPAFTFSVVLPRVVGQLTGGAEADKKLTEALELAKLVEARCVVLQTPPEVRPTKANRDKLVALAAKIARPSVALCWEPSGLWEPAEIYATARAMSAIAVVDATETKLPNGAAVYTRIRSLGGRRTVSARGIATIAEQLQGRRDAWVVVEDKRSATKLRAELARAMTRLGPATGPVVVKPSPGRLRAEDEEQ